MRDAHDLAFVILAAGRGKRMRSARPKVLHELCGRPLLLHATALASALGAARSIVVVGTGQDEIGPVLDEHAADVEVVIQRELLGTGHAVLQAREVLAGHQGPLLVMYADHALFRPETLQGLIDAWAAGADLALLTGELPDPTGYGRIVRDPGGRIERIVEQRDASARELAILESNLGVYVARADWMLEAVSKLDRENRQNEFLLPDVVATALQAGLRVESAPLGDPEEAFGINTRIDLAQAESILRRRIARRWMLEGVSFVDPEHTYVDVEVEIGAETILEPGCRLRGRTRLGSGCRVAVGAVLDDTTAGDRVWIKPHCWAEQARIGDDCSIGPSAHLRPGTVLGDGVRIGNFVEVKNSTLGAGTKADHLSYLGDADVGEGVTIGCGAITVNYDGETKHRTVIEDGAFVGCNANLIAPVTVGRDVYVAAGSTITREIEEGSLAVARARQRNIEGWRERRFGRKREE